jgi:hypothetical protein
MGLADMTKNTNGLVVALAAVAGAVIYGLGLYFLTADMFPNAGMIVAAFLFGVPIATCSLATLIADWNTPKNNLRPFQITLVIVSSQLVAGVIALREGGVCMIMAAPLFYAAGLAGAALARVFLRMRGGRALCLTLVVLPLVALPSERGAHYPTRQAEVITVVKIAAPPETVWRHTVSIPEIDPRALPATFSHAVAGAPRPVRAILDGHGVGAVRKLTWTNGVHFEEHVTRWTADRALAWDFRFGPDSIPVAVERHIDVQSQYLNLESGDYQLEPLAGGRTRLTLRTRYRLTTPINGYCKMWGDIFLNDFHRVVLAIIRQRAEADATAAT